MTLNDSDNNFNPSCNHDKSSNWDMLYSSQIWTNSNLRKAIIHTGIPENRGIQYCYTCRGKIRNYAINSPQPTFIPSSHSTPKLNTFIINEETNRKEIDKNYLDVTNYQEQIFNRETSSTNIDLNRIELSQCIPTISQQIDDNFCKYRSTDYNVQSYGGGQRRLRKSLKGLKCIVNFSLTDNPKKKRTQIQACSISVMIIAIVVISLILVNFTSPNFINMTNVTSTNVVPIKKVESNKTTSAIVNIDSVSTVRDKYVIDTSTYETIQQSSLPVSKNNNTSRSSVISKIRKNIKTYPKGTRKKQESDKPKDIINRDISQRFCSCQMNEICMLDEVSGTGICKTAEDMDDPTGCGGLCALETEACYLIDKSLGVRVCRRLPMVTCSSQDWQCRNGLCIPLEARCDGYIQCYDRSDEMQCDCDLTTEFRCGHSLSCFSDTKICDGVIDCWDGYDEVNCTLECPKGQFTCTNSQCIPSLRFCDGFADCGDSSDEPEGCDGACGAHEIRCSNNRCVSLSARCNRRDDCGDNSDELNCSMD